MKLFFYPTVDHEDHDDQLTYIWSHESVTTFVLNDLFIFCRSIQVLLQWRDAAQRCHQSQSRQGAKHPAVVREPEPTKLLCQLSAHRLRGASGGHREEKHFTEEPRASRVQQQHQVEPLRCVLERPWGRGHRVQGGEQGGEHGGRSEDDRLRSCLSQPGARSRLHLWPEEPSQGAPADSGWLKVPLVDPLISTEEKLFIFGGKVLLFFLSEPSILHNPKCNEKPHLIDPQVGVF